MDKKAELSVNIIIVVVLGLLVLVILAFVFADKIAGVNNASSCIELGGICKVNGCGDSLPLVDKNNNPAHCKYSYETCCPIIG